MTILPELQTMLHDAVERGDFAPPKRRRRRWFALGGVAGALVLGGGAAVAAGLWQPQLGSSKDPVTRATTPVHVDLGTGLAVLDRPQSTADRDPAVEAALTHLSRHGLGAVDTAGIRLVGTHEGGIALLVPAGRTGPDDAAASALRRYSQLCLIYTTTTAASQHCGAAADLRAGRISGFAPRDHDGIIGGLQQSHVFGVVPDGVRSVQVRLQDGTTGSAAVRGNFYDLTTASVAAPASVTWVAADGNTRIPGAP